jgi:hypothetical protein
MAIGTTTALLGAAAIGGSVLGASKAAKASKYAANQQAEAARESNELNRYIFDQTRADNETRRQVGDSALLALAGGFGLPATASPGAAMTLPASNYGGYGARDAMLGPSAKAATMTGPTFSAPPSGAPDYAAYGAQNADVSAEWQRIVDTGNAGRFGNDPNAYYAWHYDNYGQGEGRPLPGVTPPPAAPVTTLPAPADTGGAPAGYSDPTAPGGYMIGARPDPGPAPAAYAGPSRAAPSLDLSLDSFRASPDYEFQVREMEKGLGNLMSARGGIYSGQRMKAALDRSRSLADAEYEGWAGRQMSRYGLDLAQWNTDRAFDYGQSRDARGDFVQDRGRSDGLYADDRAYTTGRYDTRNNTLLNLAGFGASASNANANAAQTFAQQTGANNMAAATARGDAAINGANAWNQGLGNLMTTGAYLWGSGAFGGGGSSLPKTYSI